MAIILNLETATTVCSVALAKDGELLAFREVNGDYSHAENLTVFANEVLAESGYSFKQLDAIAVSKGPGSFTGLRIGVSTAKGYCYALNKPLIALNTLQSMANDLSSKITNQIPGAVYCPMIDARRMEVYCAVYDENNKQLFPTSAEVITKDSFSSILKETRMVFLGDGAAKCKPLFLDNPNAIFFETVLPSAKYMCLPAERSFNENLFEDVAYFEPFYLKDFVVGGK